MKAVEKSKAQKALDKIQAGVFDENDVDNLFMRLRAYSSGFPIFREIADFVAHNDIRDRGLTNKSLQAMYYSMKYFNEYVSPKKRLDISRPFPTWIKVLFKYQADKVNADTLKEKFNVSSTRLKSRIDNGFKDDSKTNLTHLKPGKISKSTVEAISYVMSFIVPKEAFSQDSLFDEMKLVLSKNKLNYDEKSLSNSYEKIILCVLLLLHNSEFEYSANSPGYCRVTSEKLSISHNVTFVDKDGKEVEVEESFGNLQVNGYVVLEKGGKNLTIGYPVLATNLQAESWCSPDCFVVESWSPDVPNYLHKKLKLEGDLLLNDEFKLQRVVA